MSGTPRGGSAGRARRAKHARLRVLGTIAVVASWAVVAGAAGPAAASPVSTTDSTPTGAAAPDPQTDQDVAGVRTFGRPVAAYTDKACLTDLSTVPIGTVVDLLVNQCGFLIELSPATISESVPQTWQKWAQRPHVETPRPDVLWTNGSRTLTLSWGSQNTIGGAEIQPRLAGSDVFTADYFSGPNGTGTLVATVVRRSTAPGGARLIAAQTTTTWQSVVITSRSGGDFAVAQIRGS